MKKIFLLVTVLLVFLCPSLGTATEVSSDKMILEWTSNKVWVNAGELCVTGTFVNKRRDVTITKLNDFAIRLTYIDKDGQTKQFIGKPVKLPFCKIMAGSSRKINLNFGKFEDEVHKWVLVPDYVFSYIDGARF